MKLEQQIKVLEQQIKFNSKTEDCSFFESVLESLKDYVNLKSKLSETINNLEIRNILNK